MLPVARREQLVIVAVEDHEPTLELLCEILHEEGYRAVGCRNAETAYQTIQNEQPDLIILDVLLDGSVSGLMVLETLRLTPATAETPVIICSADSKFLREQDQLIRLYKCKVLEKPFDLDVLLNMMKDAFSEPKRCESFPHTQQA